MTITPTCLQLLQGKNLMFYHPEGTKRSLIQALTVFPFDVGLPAPIFQLLTVVVDVVVTGG
jgi:hypothetical protein